MAPSVVDRNYLFQQLLICIVYYLLTVCHQQVSAYYDQSKLEAALFQKYNRKLRPSKDLNTRTDISMAVHIRHIEAVDDFQQTVTFHGVIFMAWHDHFLQWSPGSYNGTSAISLQSWKIWQPDIALFNSVSGSDVSFNYWKYPVWVTESGSVAEWQDFSFTVTCKFDFYEFPNDKQTCTAVLGSWMYDSTEIDWKWIEHWNVKVRLAWYGDEKLHSSGWQLGNVNGSKAYWGPNGLSSNSPTSMPSRFVWPILTITLDFQRHRPYFYVTEVLPLVLIGALTLASFWIETETLTLLILIVNLLSQSILSWGLLSQLPPSAGRMPRIIVIYGLSFALTSTSLFLHIIFDCLRKSRWNVVPQSVHDFTNKASSSLKPLSIQGLSFYDVSPLEEDQESIITADENQSTYKSQQQSSTAAPAQPGKAVRGGETEKGARFIFFIRRILFFIYLVIYIGMVITILA